MGLKCAFLPKKSNFMKGKVFASLLLVLLALVYLMSHSSPSPSPASALTHLVLLGDSIFEGWHIREVKGLSVVNMGVAGETTDEILARFKKRKETELKNRLVVILGGTNDIAAFKGKYDAEKTFANIKEMVEIVRYLLCLAIDLS